MLLSSVNMKSAQQMFQLAGRFYSYFITWLLSRLRDLDLPCNLLFFGLRKVDAQHAVFVACANASRIDLIPDPYRSAVTSAAAHFFVGVFIACRNCNRVALPIVLDVDVIFSNTGHIYMPVVTAISFFDVGRASPTSLKKVVIEERVLWKRSCHKVAHNFFVFAFVVQG